MDDIIGGNDRCALRFGEIVAIFILIVIGSLRAAALRNGDGVIC